MSKKNEFQTKALAAVMTASMVTGMAPASVYAASGEQVAKDGTYTQTTHVKDGDEDGWSEYDVNVSLTVENGKFKDITVTPSASYNDESKTYLNWAVDANTSKRVGIRTKLLNQSATESTINSWDTVSGATYTSKAIKEAALAAIKSAPAADAEVKIDTTALESAIAKAEALQKDSYTEASWNAMQTKLTAAKDALTKKESQDAVTTAVSELETAISGLEAAPVTPTEKVEYVLMNIPYADFYASELNNSVAVDSVSSATLNKTRTSSMVGGSYHVSQGGEDITGIVFPVKVPEGMDLSKFKQVTDSDSVTISVTNRGQTKETTYTGKDALFENASYSYYVLSEAPAYYKEATVDASGNVSFRKVQGTVNKVSGVTGEFKTTSKYGDYQLNLDGITFDTDEISAVVFSTKEGHDYGMRHLENVWKGHKIAWCTGFTTSVHGCPTSSAHYAQMMGETIDKVTYYTTNGIYEMDLDDIYVPVKTSATLSVDNAFVKSGETKVNFENLPSDFDAEYSVEGLDAKVENGVLKFNNAAKGKYTLVVKDKKGKYADMSADFMLQTEDMPATYDAEKTALVTAEGFKAEDLQEYVKSITSVSVNGTSYAASGRGATVIVNEDGSIKTDAAPFANGTGDYQIVVSATGYKDLEFTYTVAASEEEYKYVYAGLSWAEYWASEGVYLAAGNSLTSSSDVADKKGELDKGAFDTVSRATTNHGLHRGSYQCTSVIYDTDGNEYPVSYWNSSSEAVLTDGRVITFSKGTITYTENGVEKTATMKDYEVKGIKYVPVKVKASDYAEFSKQYQVVENAGTLAGGFTEKNLQAYTETAEVTEKTNGLKEATKNEDGSFSFGARATGSESGLKDNALKVAEGIEPEVKKANGSYGEFLRVDLNGNYGGLGAGMYATRWTYYGNDSTYTTALASYGTKFAADNWMHKSMGVQLGLTKSLRCTLPEGTDGTGYWTITISALGYKDVTYNFQATDENIVKDAKEEISTTNLEAAIKKAESLTESDYTADSWAAMQTELQEAKDELKTPHSQATVDEAASHLNAAIEALAKAEKKETYVLMNIPYAAFYRSETTNNDVDVDVFTSATKNKTRTTGLAGGSYHENADGSQIDGITFAVKVDTSVDLTKYKEVKDTDKVDITVTNRGQTSTTTLEGKDTLFENETYAYYPLTEAPANYKEVSMDKDGKLVFSEVKGKKAEVLTGVTAELLTQSSYGDYQLNLDGLPEDKIASSNVNAVVVKTTDGTAYGMRHLENIWRGNELAWSTGYTESVHGCPTSSAHYASMMGKTIDSIEYYTTNGLYTIDVNDLYVPVKFAKTEDAVKVADADISAGKTAIELNLRDDFDPEYTVEGLNVKVEGNVLTFKADSSINPGKYTLTVKDKNGKYADLKTTFILSTTDMPATYDADNKKLTVAENSNEEAFNTYIGNITSVNVNGTDYAASGRGSVKIIDKDGTLVTDAAPFKDAAAGAEFQITVTSTGYTTPLTFTYKVPGETPAPSEVDTTKLAAAIEKAEGLNESDYTKDSWKALQSELTKAKSALEAKESQDTVDKAADSLNKAIDALEAATPDEPTKEVSTDALEKAIKAAGALKESDYTADSWKALQSALAEADTALKEKKDQDTVDKATEKLNKAISALVKKDAGQKINGTNGTTGTSGKSGKTGSTSNTKSGKAAKTGDPSGMFAWLGLAVTSLGAGIGGFSLKRKKREDEE